MLWIESAPMSDPPHTYSLSHSKCVLTPIFYEWASGAGWGVSMTRQGWPSSAVAYKGMVAGTVAVVTTCRR